MAVMAFLDAPARIQVFERCREADVRGPASHYRRHSQGACDVAGVTVFQRTPLLSCADLRRRRPAKELAVGVAVHMAGRSFTEKIVNVIAQCA